MKIDICTTNPNIFLLGDVHWGARSDSLLFHNYMSKYFDNLFDYLITNKIDVIVQFGDLFDRRKYINFSTLAQAQKSMLNKLREHGIKMVVLVGNHDAPYKNTIKVNSVKLLTTEYADVVTAIEDPTELTINGKPLALVIPWMCIENHDESIKAIEQTNSPLCFGHFEIAGFQMYKGAVCEHGIDHKTFAKFLQVYSGHFHHVSTDKNITYIGSPFQLTWADFNDPRGGFVLNTETFESEFVPNPFIMFHAIDYNDKEIEMDYIDAIELDSFKEAYVKVKILHREKPLLLERLVDRLNQAHAISHTVDMTAHHTTINKDEVIEADDISVTFKNSVKAFSKDIQNPLYRFLLNTYNEAYEQVSM